MHSLDQVFQMHRNIIVIIIIIIFNAWFQRDLETSKCKTITKQAAVQ